MSSWETRRACQKGWILGKHQGHVNHEGIPARFLDNPRKASIECVFLEDFPVLLKVRDAMRVTINGKPDDISGRTVLEMLKAKDISPQMVAVELNSKILERDQLGSTVVKEGDAIELLFYMGGGS